MELHEDVGVGELQFTLNLRHQARDLENLALLGGRQLVLYFDAVFCDGLGKAIALGLGKRCRDNLFKNAINATSDCNLDFAAAGVADIHVLAFRQLGNHLGRSRHGVLESRLRLLTRPEQAGIGIQG